MAATAEGFFPLLFPGTLGRMAQLFFYEKLLKIEIGTIFANFTSAFAQFVLINLHNFGSNLCQSWN